MNEFISMILGSGLSVISILSGASVDTQELPQGASCQAPAWVSEPVFEDNMFQATIYSDCVITSVHGGDYAMLEKYAVDQITARAQVHRGPVSEVFEELPSQFYDVTLEIKGSKTTTVIRQDAHVATDGSSQLILATFSKKITGTGNAKYLKKEDARLDVSNTATQGSHAFRLSSTTFIERPWFAPQDLFMSELKSRFPTEFVKIRDKVVTEVSNNL